MCENLSLPSYFRGLEYKKIFKKIPAVLHNITQFDLFLSFFKTLIVIHSVIYSIFNPRNGKRLVICLLLCKHIFIILNCYRFLQTIFNGTHTSYTVRII